MDSTMLLKETGRYLEDYLEDFVVHERDADIRFFAYGAEVPAFSVNQFEDVDKIDFHKARFRNLYDRLPEAELFDFVRVLTHMDDLVLVDVGNMLMGADFSLWVAALNPSAEVHVYNPDMNFDLPKFLFNEHNKDKLFKLKNRTGLDNSRAEESTKELFAENGIDNISHHYDIVRQADLKKIAEENSGKNVVFFSRRTPTMPEEMTSQIAEVVAGHHNAGMILLPLFNTRICAYQDDRIMQLINMYRFARDHYRGPTCSPEDNAASRLFTATQQYYALKAGSIVGGRAKVYRESHFETGFPFHHPTHYVSTIDPKIR